MKKILFIPIILFVAAILVVNVLTPYGAATTPDSLSYFDLAANIKNGHGYCATDFSLEHIQDFSCIENRLWPPLYSTLLAIVIQQAFDVISVTYLSAALLFITALLVYFTLISYTHWFIAFLSSLLLCITSPMITTFTYVWSETLFIPLLMLATWSSVQYLECHQNQPLRQIALIFTLLFSLILLVYTRYIGIIFFALIPFIYFMRKKSKHDHLLSIVMTVLYLASVGYLLIKNYLISNSIMGGMRVASDKTFPENLSDSLAVLLTILPHSSLIILMLIVISLGTLFLKHELISHYRDKKILIFTLLFISSLYVISLLIFRTYAQFDQLDVRLFAPIFPMLWMLLFVIIPINKIIHVISIFLILAFSTTGYNQLIQSIEYWKRFATPHHFLSGKIFYENFTLPPLRKEKLKQLLSELSEFNEESLIISRKPLKFKFILGVKTLQQPEFIDLEFLRKINILPKSSLILYQKDEENPFATLLTQYEISYEYLEIGNTVAIKLPVNISPRL